ncbi:diguanylate cyclase [Shimia sp. SDUM112013]|uniref:diguanylate cyclase domain-containing protein n=1 Tax=Shimia sp. SDUM112013 TaxID=3136160 RepID=UPI0032ECF63B
MPGKILILDNVPTNRIVLKVKLSSAFYHVSQAATLNDAITQIRRDPPDLILVSAENSTDGGGIEQCRTLVRIRPSLPIPVVLLTSEMTRGLRISALSAGAEDILEKPVSDPEFFARLRAILRVREAAEDMRLRARTTRALGFSEAAAAQFDRQATLVIATQDPALGLRWRTLLKPLVPYALCMTSPAQALRRAHRGAAPDAFVIGVDPRHPEEGLRLLAEIRARSASRHCAVLVVIERPCDQSTVDAFDLGASAVMTHGFDPEEMALRLAAIIQQKRLRDRLDRSVRDGLEAAVTDPLTGLFNRRYALPQLRRMLARAGRDQRDMAVMVADLDHFKQVNDRYGHAGGDEVLKQVAHRMRTVLRPHDLLARIGGEEFLIALPGVATSEARRTAETLCDVIRRDPLPLKGQDRQVSVTLSIGLGMVSDLPRHLLEDVEVDAADLLLKAADRALYGAKETGRDQVTFRQSASRAASGLN